MKKIGTAVPTAPRKSYFNKKVQYIRTKFKNICTFSDNFDIKHVVAKVVPFSCSVKVEISFLFHQKLSQLIKLDQQSKIYVNRLRIRSKAKVNISRVKSAHQKLSQLIKSYIN